MCLELPETIKLKSRFVKVDQHKPCMFDVRKKVKIVFEDTTFNRFFHVRISC